VESRPESKAIVLRSAADGARAARDEQQQPANYLDNAIERLGQIEQAGAQWMIVRACE
jgi:2-methylisocitrate lyase-like PEP mutase family enzyme